MNALSAFYNSHRVLPLRHLLLTFSFWLGKRERINKINLGRGGYGCAKGCASFVAINCLTLKLKKHFSCTFQESVWTGDCMVSVWIWHLEVWIGHLLVVTLLFIFNCHTFKNVVHKAMDHSRRYGSKIKTALIHTDQCATCCHAIGVSCHNKCQM